MMQVYKVGGAVRDRLLGLDCADTDYVVVGADEKTMLDLGYSQVGHDFPVFLHPKTHEEYALARTERKSGKGYLGFVCSFSPDVTLEEDLRRRDLTINAIAENELGQIIDPYGGADDIEHKVLRHVSEAFVEDPLRVLRVARFAAKLYHLGFHIADETLSLMRDMSESGELSALTPERVWKELYKALCTRNPEIFIEVLRDCGALKVVMPEVDALYGVPGPKRWHPEIDSGVHTCLTLARVSCESEDPVVRFAMLCHDLGKGRTPVKQWPHHPLHHMLGVEPLQEMCKRLHIPKQYEDFAYKVVRYHSDMHHVYRDGGEGIVSLFDALDAWRKPELVKPWVLCCKCDFLGRLGFSNRPFPRADYILGAFALCRNITAREFVEKGAKGSEIRDLMHAKRVALVNEYLTQLPKSELDDSANEMPPADLRTWRPLGFDF